MTHPNPNYTNPSTRDRLYLRETKVGVSGDNRGYQLRNAEGGTESSRRAFHEEEAMRTGDEDQRLRYNSNLKVYNHVKLRVIATGRGWTSVEGNFELVIEEVGL